MNGEGKEIDNRGMEKGRENKWEKEKGISLESHFSKASLDEVYFFLIVEYVYRCQCAMISWSDSSGTVENQIGTALNKLYIILLDKSRFVADFMFILFLNVQVK